MTEEKIIVLLGSGSDLPFAYRVRDFLRDSKFPVKCVYRINSAHRNIGKLLDDLKGFEQSGDKIVYITIAGLSDALSGVVAGNSRNPVIACPPDLEKHGLPKAFSSMMMPKGIAVNLVSSPENAAFAAVKILALSNHSLQTLIVEYMNGLRAAVAKADANLLEKKEHERELEHIEHTEHLTQKHMKHAEAT